MADYGDQEEQGMPVFNDRVAKKVSWRPLHTSEADTKYCHIVIDGDKLVVKRSMVYFIILIFGAVIGGYIAFTSLEGGVAFFGSTNTNVVGTIIAAIVCFTMLSMPFSIYRNIPRQLTFDRSSSVYYHGRRYCQDDTLTQGKQGQLASIYALQIVEVNWRGDSNKKNIFELNLVFRDGNRAHVLDHTDLPTTQESANTLAEFLGVPVWTRDAN